MCICVGNLLSSRYYVAFCSMYLFYFTDVNGGKEGLIFVFPCPVRLCVNHVSPFKAMIAVPIVCLLLGRRRDPKFGSSQSPFVLRNTVNRISDSMLDLKTFAFLYSG